MAAAERVGVKVEVAKAVAKYPALRWMIAPKASGARSFLSAQMHARTTAREERERAERVGRE